MNPDDLRERISAQFSYRSDRSDIWKGFDLLLDTDSFLNLGYSRRYQSHLVGSSQRRLATKVGDVLAMHLRTTENAPLVDIGSGRGGPAIHLANRLGFDVTGLDLVPYNVNRATDNARDRDVDARFVVGDATSLPFAPESMVACTAIDSLVYISDRSAAVSEIFEVLEPDGVVVCSTLVMRSRIGTGDRRAVVSFADAWDMSPLGTIGEYRTLFADAGFGLESVEDITHNSIGRFRTWTSLFLRLYSSPARALLRNSLRRYGLDPSTIDSQVRRTHDALPHMRHVIFAARK